MTDHSDVPDDPLDKFDVADGSESFGETTNTTPRGRSATDRYDLQWLFLCWAWEAGYQDWGEGVRALARTLKGLEQLGLIERRTIRRAGEPTHHGLVLTDRGRRALVALSGDWIEEVG